MNDAHRIWKLYIVPIAKAIETFFWRIVLLSIVICSLASYNPFKQGQTVNAKAVDFTPVFDLVHLILICLQVCMEWL